MSDDYHLNLNMMIYMQERYEKALASIAEMEKRVVVAESMLEATLQYESGQSKAHASPRYMRILLTSNFCFIFSLIDV